MSYLNHSTRRNFIEQMEGLVKMCSSKHITVKPGDCAKTDGKSTIWLPWLPENATEEDYLKFFCKAGHEQAHFEGKSDVSLMKGNDPKYERIHAMLVNIADDIRCENIQEKTYPGYRIHRKPYYEIWMREHGLKKFATASKQNMTGFIHALGCLAICKVRHPHVGLDNNYELSPELKTAYDKYFRDLESEMDAQDKFDDSLRLAGIMLERIKELIKNQDQDDQPQQSENNDSNDQEDDQNESEDNDSNDQNESEDNDSNDQEDDQNESEDNNSNDQEDDQNESEDSGDGNEEEEKNQNESEDNEDGENNSNTGNDNKENSNGEKQCGKGLTPEEIEKQLRKLNSDPDLKGTIDDDITEDINKIAEDNNTYLVSPDVQDVIKYNRETDNNSADEIYRQGVEILGVNASKLTRLFVNNTRKRIVRNRQHGRLDMMAVNADIWDTRKDIRTITKKGRLDKAAVSFVIDCSASMRRNNKIQIADSILSVMLKTLAKASIPTEAVGFTCQSSSSKDMRNRPSYLTIIKKFTDKYDRKVMNRCCLPEIMQRTNEIDALRWAVPRLLARKETKKVLFVLGDGRTELGHYELDRKAASAYKNYIQKCKEIGIFVCGFGINVDLSHIYGDDFIYVKPNTMGDEILNKLKDILNRPVR